MSAFIISRHLAYNPDFALSFGAGSQPFISWPYLWLLLSQLSLAYNLLPNYQVSYLPPAPLSVNFTFLSMVNDPRSSSPIRSMFLPSARLKVLIHTEFG